MVSLTDQASGRPLVRLEPTSPLIEHLSECPVATLILSAPAPYRTQVMVAALEPVRREVSRDRLSVYRPRLISVTLHGPGRRALDVTEFLEAEPDPVAGPARPLLEHLRRHHGAELLACLQAHGYHAEAVEPVALDAWGLELVLLRADGVSRARLRFPHAPVRNLDELGPGLATALRCRCHRSE